LESAKKYTEKCEPLTQCLYQSEHDHVYPGKHVFSSYGNGRVVTIGFVQWKHVFSNYGNARVITIRYIRKLNQRTWANKDTPIKINNHDNPIPLERNITITNGFLESLEQ